jgi:hypothetical protein
VQSEPSRDVLRWTDLELAMRFVRILGHGRKELGEKHDVMIRKYISELYLSENVDTSVGENYFVILLSRRCEFIRVFWRFLSPL